MQGYGLNAVIFARAISDPLTSLVKQMDRHLEEAARRNGSAPLGVFVVICNDDPGLQQKLQALAGKEGLKRVVLCATNAEAGLNTAIGAVSVSEVDAQRLGIQNDQTVRLRSKNGTAEMPVRVNNTVRPGELHATS